MDRKELIESLVEHLREEQGTDKIKLPDNKKYKISVLSDAVLLELVEIAVETASSFELYSDEEFFQFVSIMFSISPNFHEQKTIRKLVHDIWLPIEDYFDDANTTEEDWEEAEQIYNPQAWTKEYLTGLKKQIKAEKKALEKS